MANEVSAVGLYSYPRERISFKLLSITHEEAEWYQVAISYRFVAFFNYIIIMRLIVKYYNEWGKFTSIQINVSSKGKVLDLKRVLERHTSIRYSLQDINIVCGDDQFQISEDDTYLADYKITEKSIVYVVSKRDEFSFELPDNSQSNSQVYSSLSLSQMAQKYSETEYQRILLLMIEAVKKEDIEQLKTLLKKHKEGLFTLIDETNDQDEQNLIKEQFDILNDITNSEWSVTQLSAFIGNEKILLWTLSEGGDFKLTSKDGWDCTLLAIWQGHYQILRILIGQPKIDILKVTSRGSPLHLACEIDDPKSVQILLNHPSINIFLLDKQDKKPIHLAGVKTKPLMEQEEMKYKVPSQNSRLLESFTHSIRSMLDLSKISKEVPLTSIILSFMINMPPRPPLLRGQVYKVNYFKFRKYQRYLILDPESGALARFKSIDDAPLHPNELIALEHINDIRISKGKWFQEDDLIYIEISYLEKKIYIALKHKAAARQWFDALRNSVGYVKYLSSKISTYQQQSQSKAQKSIVQIMMQNANKEIIIEDDDRIDSKSHIKHQFQKQQERYNQAEHLNSVSEKSDEECSVGAIRQNSNQTVTTSQHVLEKQTLLFSDFELIELAGRGSFGNVFKARLKLNGKIYALKQQDKDKMITTNQIGYVMGELNILKQIRHPFIIHLHFAFQTPYFLYLVLDYCGNGDLSKYVTRGVILDELTAKFIIAQIILAIECLHEKNIIYRDLKPENIIIDDEGYIKLIDFGLSKVGDEEDFVAKSFCGSPAYLSPEIISQQGTTKHTDIYTIGTILFEMLVGYPPFFTTNVKQLLHNIKFQSLLIPNNVSKEAKSLLKKMLDKNPDTRITLSQVKKHIFFAEINFEKLLQKKYMPPKLKKREIQPNSKSSIAWNQSIQDQLMNDKDYETQQQRLNEIQGWNFGF